MPSLLSLAVIAIVLQFSEPQRIYRFTACMHTTHMLRLDCRFENRTDNPLRYEFTLTKDREEIVASTIQPNFFNQRYHERTTVNVSRNLVCLYLNKYSQIDKGTYGCRLQMDNDYTDKQLATVKVMKDYLERCGGVSLIQSVPSLLFLLLLPLLQAANVVSL
ncbi:thy-1 membrane glycoprotein [Ambystoma mexicanum]|uniref:thy-1 membrane glycoprotein n=1 Tax=Ambystoma mexicanum TaxID=8296 RepID=UPI0037E7B026